MEIVLKTEDDVNKILERYNQFHDGFIKNLNYLSNDYFDSDKNLISSGLVDINIDFAHYNYSGATPPYNQVIRACFSEIRKLSLNFEEIKCGDWAIYNINLEKAEKEFIIKIVFDFFDRKSNIWTKIEGISFSFKKAKFVEA